MKKLLPNKKGFTLVELLVVVAIIAVLSVIGLTIFTGLQKNARDAKRRADVDAISNTLEVNYITVSASYPVVANTMFSSGVVPQDPLGGAYSGVPNTAGATYNICADLENDGRAPTDTTPNDYCKREQQ